MSILLIGYECVLVCCEGGSEDSRRVPVRKGKSIKVENTQTGPTSPSQALEEPMDTSPLVTVKLVSITL